MLATLMRRNTASIPVSISRLCKRIQSVQSDKELNGNMINNELVIYLLQQKERQTPRTTTLARQWQHFFTRRSHSPSYLSRLSHDL